MQTEHKVESGERRISWGKSERKQEKARNAMSDKQTELAVKLAVSLMACGLGGLCMYLTAGGSGIGWAVLALAVIWGS